MDPLAHDPAPEHDPSPIAETDAVIAALARLRGARGGRRHGGPGGFPGGFPGAHGPGGFPGSHGTDPRLAGGPEGRGDHEGHGGPWAGRAGGEHGARGPGARGPRGGFGGPALLRLLSTLAHATEPLTVNEIAGEIGVDQPRASRLVQQAVERGFAAREADPEDARRTRVRIAPAGEDAVHGFRGRQRAEASAALAALDPAERAELARLLTKLAEAWPRHEEPGSPA